MARTHLVISDAHAHPDYPNDRADWMGQLILDLKPDIVVQLGDLADMASLSSYDKGLKSFVGRTYQKDIESALDFQQRLYGPTRKAKRKSPKLFNFVGNHEQRIAKAVSIQPELEGTIGLNDLGWRGELIPYNGLYPGVVEIDGVSYGHFMVSGVMGRPISGDRHAFTLINKKLTSCTVGHTHVFDFHMRSKVDGSKSMALVMPCAMDYEAPWAGQSGDMWSQGVVVKRNVEGGQYDLEYISMARLKKEYGPK